MRRFRLASALAVTLLTSACAMGPLSAPQASLDTIQSVRASGIARVNVGDFRLADGKRKSMDHTLTIRAGVVSAPGDGSFSSYLRQILIDELTSGGKYDAQSPIVISGELTNSDVDAGLSKGHGVLAAHFVVRRDGAIAYDKVLEVQSDWEGDFFGAVAIPDAMNHYNALYPKLIATLLSDTAFQSAVKSS